MFSRINFQGISTEPLSNSVILFENVFNPFPTNVPLLYPLKPSEKVFRYYRSGPLIENGLRAKIKVCLRHV